MSKTLKIKNVDFKLLDKQRLTLAHVLEELRVFSDFTTAKEHTLLAGLLTMLDHWSDERYFAKKNKEK